MGYFSWDCRGCGHSVREGRGWMGKAVVQSEDGSTFKGSYDGYGRVEGAMGTVELDHGQRWALWHQACHKLAGGGGFSAASKPSRDQGLGPSDEYPEPTTQDHLAALLELSREAARKDREARQRQAECQREEQALIGDAAKCGACGFTTYFVIEHKAQRLAIRCPNPKCRKLRPFPEELEGRWHDLQSKYPDLPVIWEDRVVGPHFETVRWFEQTLASYEEELRTVSSDDEDLLFLTRRMEETRSKLVEARREAEASEAAETL